MIVFNRIIAAVGLGAAALMSTPAVAAAPPSPPCGVTGSAAAPPEIRYDPFASTGISQLTVPLTLTRAVDSGGKKTQEVYFVLTQPVGGPNITVQATTPGGTTYSNVLYYENAVPSGLPKIQNNLQGQIEYQFGGAALPDTATIDIRITVPPGTNLAAHESIQLNILYVCKGTGGMTDVLSPTPLTNAISININVLSALQASYAGTDLAFGEIGNVTNTQVTITPANYRTSPDNFIRVQSSGPYRVSLTSGNGYRMTYPTGSLANPVQRVNYALKFVGESRNEGATTAITKTCSAAGVGAAFEDKLYLQATLREGGQGKQVAPDYRDLLTVTIEPLIVPNPSLDCNAFTIP